MHVSVDSGPVELFGSAARYHTLIAGYIASGVLLDEGMFYFDARLSRKCPTVEVRVRAMSGINGDLLHPVDNRGRPATPTLARKPRHTSTKLSASKSRKPAWTWLSDRRAHPARIPAGAGGQLVVAAVIRGYRRQKGARPER